MSFIHHPHDDAHKNYEDHNDDDDNDDHYDDDEDDKDNLLKNRSQISMTILIMIMLSCLAPST